MKLLILGDIMGASGRKAIKDNIKNIINENEVDFTIVNGENSADDGRGITNSIAEEFFNLGVDVLTSGNHIYDQKETTEFIEKETRLLRPNNFIEGSPGRGFGVYESKNKKFKIGVINLMGNVFMKKTEDLFQSAKILQEKMKLKKNADFIVIDLHGEITSEKNAMAHFFDGKATAVVGTHTHIPTADTRVLPKGTAFQTDIGMCGDYNSVIGMDKQNSIMRFLKDKNAKAHFPAQGTASLSGIIVNADNHTGLAKSVERFFLGGVLNH